MKPIREWGWLACGAAGALPANAALAGAFLLWTEAFRLVDGQLFVDWLVLSLGGMLAVAGLAGVASVVRGKLLLLPVLTASVIAATASAELAGFGLPGFTTDWVAVVLLRGGTLFCPCPGSDVAISLLTMLAIASLLTGVGALVARTVAQSEHHRSGWPLLAVCAVAAAALGRELGARETVLRWENAAFHLAIALGVIAVAWVGASRGPDGRGSAFMKAWALAWVSIGLLFHAAVPIDPNTWIVRLLGIVILPTLLALLSVRGASQLARATMRG